jgi:hypothetical protein
MRADLILGSTQVCEQSYARDSHQKWRNNDQLAGLALIVV